MEKSALIVLTLNFIAVALLPLVFFRRDGKLTLMWLATAAPWSIAPIIFFAEYYGIVVHPIFDTNNMVYSWMSGAGSVFNVLSIGLIAMTIGTHRIPLALWHQNPDDDEPASIVTWGSYKYVRHPFYSAFIMAFIACTLIAPHWSIVALGIYTVLMLNYTAHKEEVRLCNEEGQLGSEYRQYMKRTGRFFPKLTAARETLQTQS